MRVRKRYFVGETEWYTRTVLLPKREMARVVWEDREIQIDPSFHKLPPGKQEAFLRHELLHVVLGRPKGNKEHLIERISHGRIVDLGMRLDNLVHFGSDTFANRRTT